MSDSDGETTLQLPTAPAAELSDEQRAFLAECEAEFVHRFSDDDPEFVRQLREGTPEPPVMVPWFGRRQERGGWRGGRGGRDDRSRHRDRSGGWDDRDRSRSRDYRDDRRGGDYREDRRSGGDFRESRGRDGERPGGSGHYGSDRRPFY